MASPRITRTMREGIVENTINHQFAKETAAIIKRHATLADRAYKMLYPKAKVAAMEGLGEDFVRKSADIRVIVGGRYETLYFAGGSNYCNTPHLSSLRVDKQEHRFVSRDNSIIIEGKDRSDYDALHNDTKDLMERMSRAAISLIAVLESVQSFKKLRAVWAEGEKFYDMYDVDSESKASVPAVVITDLNKMLGLK